MGGAARNWPCQAVARWRRSELEGGSTGEVEGAHTSRHLPAGRAAVRPMVGAHPRRHRVARRLVRLDRTRAPECGDERRHLRVPRARARARRKGPLQPVASGRDTHVPAYARLPGSACRDPVGDEQPVVHQPDPSRAEHLARARDGLRRPPRDRSDRGDARGSVRRTRPVAVRVVRDDPHRDPRNAVTHQHRRGRRRGVRATTCAGEDALFLRARARWSPPRPWCDRRRTTSLRS